MECDRATGQLSPLLDGELGLFLVQVVLCDQVHEPAGLLGVQGPHSGAPSPLSVGFVVVVREPTGLGFAAIGGLSSRFAV